MMTMKIPNRMKDKILNHAISKLLSQKSSDEFISEFRATFDSCNGAIEKDGFCSDCKSSIPTMIKVNRSQYPAAKFDNILICRVCGRQSPYIKNLNLKGVIKILLVFLVLFLIFMTLYTPMIGYLMG